MATSAAPFYFPMAKVGDGFFVDGGLVANAPDMCAIHEAREFLGRNLMRFMSQYRNDDDEVFAAGFAWYEFGNQRLARKLPDHIDSVFRAAAVGGLYGQASLGDRYLRIDDVPSAEQCVDLGLDLATPARRQTLLGMAEGAYQKFASDPRIVETLGHQPPPPIFYN